MAGRWQGLVVVATCIVLLVKVKGEGYNNNGFKNNINEATWGMTGRKFLRMSPATYGNGAYKMAGQDRPNPLNISAEALTHYGEVTETLHGRNAMLAFFGQLVFDEVASVGEPGCPPEYENMDVPSGHPLEASRPHVFLRSVYDQSTGYTSEGVRQQTNQVSSFLDGGVIYGASHVWTNSMRTFQGGKLLVDSDDDTSSFPLLNDVGLPFLNSPIPKNHELKPADRLFRIGNTKGHESPFLLALQVIWHRWHNKVAGDIASQTTGLSDEDIFDQTKAKVIGHFQKTVFNEWLPAFLDATTTSPLPTYTGYQPRTEPDVTHEFLAAMDFRHDFTPPAVWTLGYAGGTCAKDVTSGQGPQGEARDVTSVRLCNNFWNPQDLVKSSMNNVLRGMIYTKGSTEDGLFDLDFITSFHGPYEFSRTDHAASQIQRLRDHGVSDYSSVREAYGLGGLTSWARVQKLTGIYGSVGFEQIDLLAGSFTDTIGRSNGVPELFRAVLVDQFTRLRDGDRFWWENTNSGVLTVADRQSIRSTTFRDILLSTTDLTSAELPSQLFLCQVSGVAGCPCLSPPAVRNSSAQDVDVCTPLVTHDYMDGSRLSFALVFMGLVLVVVGSIIVLKIQVHLKHKANNVKRKKRADSAHDKENMSLFRAREWLGKKSGLRYVKGEFKPKDEKIIITDGGRKILRHVVLRMEGIEKLTVMKSNDKDLSMIAIILKGDIDLILKFADTALRDHFEGALEHFVTQMNMTLDPAYVSEDVLKARAKDKDTRQEQLDLFFRAVCERVLEGDDSLNSNVPDVSNDLVQAVMYVKLNKTEFAEALGMSNTSIFAENVFLLADKNNDGHISFTEFIDLFAVFLKGTAEEKAKILFDTYDLSRDGFLSKDELRRMMTSIVEMSETGDIKDSSVDEFVTSVLRKFNLQDNEEMSFDHFRQVFCDEDFKSTLEKTKLTGEVTKHVPKPAAPKAGDPKVGSSNQGPPKKEAAPVESAQVEVNVAEKAPPMVRNKRMSKREKLIMSYLTSTGTDSSDVDDSRGKKSPAERRSSSLDPTVEEEEPEVATRAIRRVNRKTVRVSDSPEKSKDGGVASKGKSRPSEPGTKLGKRLFELSRSIQRYNKQIFWLTLYTLVVVGIFVERAYYYAKGREHAGLRRLSGAWVVAMIRGSASAIMFTYVSLLMTMCRNTITALRETFLHKYIPFDSAVDFHKYIAVLAMGSTLIHIVFHAINLYCMCTQTTASINCFFREYYTPSDSFAYFHYWAFMTITGLSGIIVSCIIFIMYVFAQEYSRKNVFKMFWSTHQLYPFVYFFTFLHGIGRLVQNPLFPWYGTGPIVLFVLDKLISISRKTTEIAVVDGTAGLPSDVLRLMFKRPASFSYRSGQWVRIACLHDSMSASDYHPFTITSAPHEPHLSLHIRAVGPWTRRVREIYGHTPVDGEVLPKLSLDGPFGEGHQDWYTSDVAVLVGGGIGVTPFASILKDIAFKSKAGIPITCKKVYFIWTTRSQRSFEWLIDIIRECEAMDTNQIVDTHIYVTQMKEKYDLRTTMLYICERFFQKVEGRSLFSGLHAVTHFNRPNFEEFFTNLSMEHKGVSQVGVFSCGPGPMTASVQKACAYMNGFEGPSFTHHFENF